VIDGASAAVPFIGFVGFGRLRFFSVYFFGREGVACFFVLFRGECAHPASKHERSISKMGKRELGTRRHTPFGLFLHV